ncbi:MAG: S9 family peptidase [Alphaproteobacteria bacterium]|nr:S9 family peptidase [Alphaproteobacteria bacterium]
MRKTLLTTTAAAFALLCACDQAPQSSSNAPAPAPTASPAPAAAPEVKPALELIDRAAIFGNPTKTSARISPDGKTLAWLAPKDGVMNIWVAPIDDLAAAKAITDEKIRPIRQMFFSPDSSMVLFINDSGGDENFLLYGAPVAGGEVKNFTPFKKTRVQIIGASEADKEHILVGLNNRNESYHDVHLLNLTTGELKLVYENNEFGGFVADDSLTLRLAFKELPGGGQDVLRFDNGKTSPFATIPAEDSITTNLEGFTTDGKTLYWLDSRGRDKAAAIAQDMATGETTLLGEFAKGDVQGLITNPVTGIAEGFGANYLKQEWFPVGDAIKADLAFLNTEIKGQYGIVSRDDADTKWILQVDETTKPVAFWLYDRTAKKLSQLFVTRPELEGKTLASMCGIEINARDGLTLTAFLTLPPGSDADNNCRPDSPVPMILNVHGGPWAQDVFGYDSEAQWAANRGYATLQVNYRGSTGFGKAFVEAATREFAGKMHEDLIDAVNWAIAEKIAPADKIAIYGGSYGGYATLVGMTFTPTTFACGVDIVGPSNLVTLIESFPAYWQPFLEGTWYRRVGDPRKPEDREFLLSRSPLSKAADIQRPLLIAQGANDPRVTKKESDQIVAEMQAKNIPVTYVLYADEGHGFARPENRISFYAVSEAFLSKCLGGRFEPVGDDFKGANVTVPAGSAFVPGLEEALKTVTP